MQKTYIIIDVDTKSQIDAAGRFVTKTTDMPSVERGQWQILCFQFVRRNVNDLGVVTTEPYAINASSLLLVADSDFNDDDSLMLKSYQSTIPFSESDTASNRFNIDGDWIDGKTANPSVGQISVRVNADTKKFADVLGNRKSVTTGLYLNIKQYHSGLSNPSSIAWFPFTAKNTIRDWGNPEELPTEGINITPFVSAFLKNPIEFEYSTDGVSWHDTQTADDVYYRQRIANISADWSEAVMMRPGSIGPQGEQGPQGADGYTPKKGVDYWTDADKNEIKNYVDNAILNGEW